MSHLFLSECRLLLLQLFGRRQDVCVVHSLHLQEDRSMTANSADVAVTLLLGLRQGLCSL